MEYVPEKVNVNNYNTLIIGIIVILLIGVICFFMNRGNKSEQKIPKIIIQITIFHVLKYHHRGIAVNTDAIEHDNVVV